MHSHPSLAAISDCSLFLLGELASLYPPFEREPRNGFLQNRHSVIQTRYILDILED